MVRLLYQGTEAVVKSVEKVIGASDNFVLQVKSSERSCQRDSVAG